MIFVFIQFNKYNKYFNTFLLKSKKIKLILGVVRGAKFVSCDLPKRLDA